MAREKGTDLGIWGVGRRQHWVVTLAQLLAVGLSEDAIAWRVREHRLWRVHRGVYSLVPQLSRHGVWLAAVLACGEGAALSHLSAAKLWEICEALPFKPDVSVPHRDGRRGPKGIRLHKPERLTATDIATHNAIPVTTLPRTLTDVALLLDDKRLRATLRQAERLHELDLVDLRAHVEARPRTAAGAARLRRLLDTVVPGTHRTESELEALFLELCARHGIPLPIPQVRIGRHRADFLWPEQRLVVEVDGAATHGGLIARADDRAKQRAVEAAGYRLLRFGFDDVVRRPYVVAEQLRARLDA